MLFVFLNYCVSTGVFFFVFCQNEENNLGFNGIKVI